MNMWGGGRCCGGRQVNSAIQQVEEGEKGYSHRKEYATLEKQVSR